MFKNILYSYIYKNSRRSCTKNITTSTPPLLKKRLRLHLKTCDSGDHDSATLLSNSYDCTVYNLNLMVV